MHGENGCGKSTLIKAVLQKTGYKSYEEQFAENGIMDAASGLKVSYVSQDTSGVSGSIDDFCEKNGLDLSLFCTVLRHLDLDRTQFLKNIEDFSEGQKKKLLIAASLLTPAHLYIWDEPLNYIDVFSRMQIEKLIDEYKPTMLFVEHDVRFRGKIATDVVELRKI